MDPVIKLNIENGNELTIRTGEALELKHPERIRLVGDIATVANFLRKRNVDGLKGSGLQFVDKEKVIVLVDDKEMSLTMLLDPNDTFGTQLKGVLEFTPELKQFFINDNKQFSREELIKLLRFNKRFFDNSLAHEDLLRAYQTLQIKTASELSQESDTRGNKGMNFQKTVDSKNIPTEFILNVPIFKGFKEERFRVEICLDATDASVRFWFESVELHELIELRKTEILNQQLDYCKDFVVINK